MGFTFTPFLTLLAVLFILIGAAAGWLIYKGWIKTGVAIIVVLVFIGWTKPFKLTTNTQSHNALADQKISEKHERHLKNLPPRVTVDRPEYDAFLKSETDKIKESK